MSKLPSLNARRVTAILFLHGFARVRTSGSHIRFRKGDRFVTVPFHGHKDIKAATLHSIIKQSGLKPQDFFSKKHFFTS